MARSLLYSRAMKSNCPPIRFNRSCCPHTGSLVRNGRFFRTSDSQYVQRWRCTNCQRTVSLATGSPCFGQNKRRVNDPLLKLLGSGVSQRRAALILNIHPITVARKFSFLSLLGRIRQTRYLLRFVRAPRMQVQFDEMETFEHSKMKPLSIALAVCPMTRKILDIQVSSIAAKGLLADQARKKYGKRADDRAIGMRRMFENIRPLLHEEAVLLSDQNPKYPGWLKSQQTTWRHQTVKGRRGCIVGQGELKKVGFDPLFSLNHTCAMIRANINRLFRKTWCTTKKAERLFDHLTLYMDFHNRELT